MNLLYGIANPQEFHQPRDSMQEVVRTINQFLRVFWLLAIQDEESVDAGKDSTVNPYYPKKIDLPSTMTVQAFAVCLDILQSSTKPIIFQLGYVWLEMEEVEISYLSRL